MEQKLLGADSYFDFIIAFIGGLIISLATSLHLYLKGRVTGMSGIFATLVFIENKPQYVWKLCLFLGIISAGSMIFLIVGFDKVNGTTPFFDKKDIMISHLDLIGFAIAGFCVGLGTKMGNGCTSGHGVCGLPRLSIRSYVAVACFMTTGIAVGTLRYYVKFLQYPQAFQEVNNMNFTACAACFLAFPILAFCVIIYINRCSKFCLTEICTGFVVGFIFGIGLTVSTMARRSKVIGFLSLGKDWDPSLAFVLGGACLPNFFTFNYMILKKKKPLYNSKLEVPTNKVIDWKLIVGASIFGFGWGFGGLCPGPAFILGIFLTPQITFIWLPFLAIGQWTSYGITEVLAKSKQVFQPVNQNQVQKEEIPWTKQITPLTGQSNNRLFSAGLKNSNDFDTYKSPDLVELKIEQRKNSDSQNLEVNLQQ